MIYYRELINKKQINIENKKQTKRIFLSSTKLMCEEMTLFRKNRNEIWKYVYIVHR